MPDDAKPGEEAPRARMIVGLGNPGAKYAGTRHNVGFAIIDRVASRRNLPWRLEKKWKADLARAAGDGLVLAKPLTFMNLSGEAVVKLCSYFKIPPREVLVVHDDADLPLGKLRFRLSGSAGGHNGLKSLIQHLGGDGFPRLKFGIGREPVPGAGPQREIVGHVLGRFHPEEAETLEKTLARAADAVDCALSEGLAVAMNRYNTSPAAPRPPREQAAPRLAPGLPDDQLKEPPRHPPEPGPDAGITLDP